MSAFATFRPKQISKLGGLDETCEIPILAELVARLMIVLRVVFAELASPRPRACRRSFVPSPTLKAGTPMPRQHEVIRTVEASLLRRRGSERDVEIEASAASITIGQPWFARHP